MAGSRVFLARSAAQELETLPDRVLSRVLERIGLLESDPHPPESEPLPGRDRYRLRLGPYRVMYEVEEAERVITIFQINPPPEATP